MLKYLAKFWEILTLIRTGLSNAVFLLLIIAVLIFALSSDERELPRKGPLVVSFSGALVDKKSYEPSPFDIIAGKPEQQETLLSDVTFAIRKAAKDKRINALLLNLNGLRFGSFSKLEEIGQAIDIFKESGNPIIAFSDSYTQQQYFLASYADEIYINNMGNVALTGFGIYQSYFKDAADKLSLKFHLFKAGDFKDAAEPYIRNNMSEASREHKSVLINQLWKRYTSIIEQRRKLPDGAISSFIDDFATTVSTTKEDFATISKNVGLVDHVVSRVELNQRLIGKFGQEKESDFFVHIGLDEYLNNIRPRVPKQKNNIGLVVGTGVIVDGEGERGQIGGDSFSALIREAINDDSLEALIVRIDSGGGSAFASEVIRDEIAAARNKDLPVYVSMSSVAASGGYWIASAAEEIWALPSTITGSIGVWGLVPNVSESFKRIGVHNDGLGTTSLSDLYQIDRPLSTQAQQLFQSGVDNIYQQFIDLVAQSRNQTPEAIHKIAQGRVWTGESALNFGLVDQLGTLEDLVSSIAKKQKLEKYNVKVIELPLTASEQFLRALMDGAAIAGNKVRESLLGKNIASLANKIPDLRIAEILLNAEHQGIRYFAECAECTVWH